MRPGRSEVERRSLTTRSLEGDLDAGEDVRVADRLDQRVADAHRTADGGAGNQLLHALVGPLDAPGLIDGDHGVLHAVDHGLKLARLSEASVESRSTWPEAARDGARKAVKVAVLVVESANLALWDRRGGDLKMSDVLANGARQQECVDRGPRQRQGSQPSIQPCGVNQTRITATKARAIVMRMKNEKKRPRVTSCPSRLGLDRLRNLEAIARSAHRLKIARRLGIGSIFSRMRRT